jgi:hypothetical protein
MNLKIPLVLAPQPEGGYVVTSPLLPELHTEGDTADEAVASRCPLIVTHNVDDFTGAERFGIEALTPAAFLRRVRGES